MVLESRPTKRRARGHVRDRGGGRVFGALHKRRNAPKRQTDRTRPAHGWLASTASGRGLCNMATPAEQQGTCVSEGSGRRKRRRAARRRYRTGKWTIVFSLLRRMPESLPKPGRPAAKRFRWITSTSGSDHRLICLVATWWTLQDGQYLIARTSTHTTRPRPHYPRQCAGYPAW